MHQHTKLIYDGAISEEIGYHCWDNLKRYPYVIELADIPDHKWIEDYLPRIVEHQDRFGNKTYRTPHYAVVQKHFHERTEDGKLANPDCFFFVETKEAYDTLIHKFPFEKIISTKPFRTEIGG